MEVKTETWCDRDNHIIFEHFSDFNEWLDSEDDEQALQIRITNGIDNFSQPSKAFFAGDKEAYEQTFKAYRIQRREEVLSKEHINTTFTGEHWYNKNESRFDQIIEYLVAGTVVPFVGAGVSVAGGFPTWAAHLRQQGRTAGIASTVIEGFLENGKYEALIQEIENTRGHDVFAQEIRDVFSKTGSLEEITLRITELFSDTIITTNYDRLLEQAYDNGSEREIQTIDSFDALEKADPNKTTIIKLHGDVKRPHKCILGKTLYDRAYGATHIDLALQIPKLLEYYYKNSNLLFIGCSMNNDRTVQVFKAARATITDGDYMQHFSVEQTPETEKELVERNAELATLGITAIWYAKGQYEFVESILKHARNEIKYKTANWL